MTALLHHRAALSMYAAIMRDLKWERDMRIGIVAAAVAIGLVLVLSKVLGPDVAELMR